MPNIINTVTQNKYFKLARMHSLTGVFLVASPCWMGVAVASQNKKDFFYWMIIFTIGAFIMRPAFCIINDILDMDIDRLIERTKNRPLASGEVCIKNAIIISSTLLILSLLIFFKLNLFAKLIAIINFTLACIYPLSKRFMKMPQVFQGVTMGMGSLISYVAVSESITSNAIALYFGCILWITGFDTIYSYQDLEGDKRIKSNSTALYITENKINIEKFLYNLYSGFLLLVLLIGLKQKLNYYFYISCIITSYMLYIQTFCNNFNSSENCMKSFKINPFIGLILTFGFFLGKM